MRQIVEGVIRVKVYDSDYGVYTKQAYEELCLQMSTGDFHMHTTHEVYLDELESLDDVFTVLDLQ